MLPQIRFQRIEREAVLAARVVPVDIPRFIAYACKGCTEAEVRRIVYDVPVGRSCLGVDDAKLLELGAQSDILECPRQGNRQCLYDGNHAALPIVGDVQHLIDNRTQILHSSFIEFS